METIKKYLGYAGAVVAFILGFFLYREKKSAAVIEGKLAASQIEDKTGVNDEKVAEAKKQSDDLTKSYDELKREYDAGKGGST